MYAYNKLIVISKAPDLLTWGGGGGGGFRCAAAKLTRGIFRHLAGGSLADTEKSRGGQATIVLCVCVCERKRARAHSSKI